MSKALAKRQPFTHTDTMRVFMIIFYLHFLVGLASSDTYYPLSYGPTHPGETLEDIASIYAEATAHSKEQWMVVLWEHNPSAFHNDNLFHIKKHATLKAPQQASLRVPDNDFAEALIQQHQQKRLLTKPATPYTQHTEQPTTPHNHHRPSASSPPTHMVPADTTQSPKTHNPIPKHDQHAASPNTTEQTLSAAQYPTTGSIHAASLIAPLIHPTSLPTTLERIHAPTLMHPLSGTFSQAITHKKHTLANWAHAIYARGRLTLHASTAFTSVFAISMYGMSQCFASWMRALLAQTGDYAIATTHYTWHTAYAAGTQLQTLHHALPNGAESIMLGCGLLIIACAIAYHRLHLILPQKPMQYPSSNATNAPPSGPERAFYATSEPTDYDVFESEHGPNVKMHLAQAYIAMGKHQEATLILRALKNLPSAKHTHTACDQLLVDMQTCNHASQTLLPEHTPATRTSKRQDPIPSLV